MLSLAVRLKQNARAEGHQPACSVVKMALPATPSSLRFLACAINALPYLLALWVWHVSVSDDVGNMVRVMELHLMFGGMWMQLFAVCLCRASLGEALLGLKQVRTFTYKSVSLPRALARNIVSIILHTSLQSQLHSALGVFAARRTFVLRIKIANCWWSVLHI